MTRRYPGQGSVDQLPSGRWRVRVRNAEGKQRTLGTYATEAEADAARLDADKILANQRQASTTSGPLTLAAWGVTWSAARERDGIRGAKQERSVWARYVERDDLGAMGLRDLKRADVVAWMARVRAMRVIRCERGKGRVEGDRLISGGTARHALHVLRSAIHAARDAGHIDGDPTDDVHVPKGAARKGAAVEAWTWLKAAEVDRVVGCQAYDLEHRSVYATAIYTGLRQGELWALRWANVTLDGATPEVLVCESHDGPPKNGLVRRVPLLPAAVAVLRGWRATFPRELAAEALVFPGETGGRRGRSDDARWSPQTRWVRKDGSESAVAGYRLRAGITRRVRFHDLRHTCASHLLQGTWGVTLALVEVRDWLGHSSIKQTERYAHLCHDRLAARVARDSRGGSGLSHEGEGTSQNPLFSARPEGLEPPTVGSEVREGGQRFRVLAGGRDSGATPGGASPALAALARTVVAHVGEGRELRRDLAVALARGAIVAGVAGELALRVLDGRDATIVAAAVQVACAVIAAEARGELRSVVA